MAAAFRSVQQTVISGGQQGTGRSGLTESFALTMPTGHTSNDILIMVLNINYGSSTLADLVLPSGWTQLWDAWQASSGDHQVVAWKRDGGSEGSSATVTWTADTEYQFADGIIAAYSGCNTGTVIDDSGAGSETTDTHHVAPSKTATYTNDIWVVLAIEDNYSNSTCSGFTERFDDSGFGPKLYDKTLSASGATGTADVVTGASGNGRAGTILLIDASPAGGGGGVTVKALAALGVG